MTDKTELPSLAGMTTAQLEERAEIEKVDISAAKNNGERVKLIEAARLAKDEPAEGAKTAQDNEPTKVADEGEQSEISGPGLIVTGPKRGFRRGGFHFGPEQTVLGLADFEPTPEGFSRFLAIVAEPKLQCILVTEDGEHVPPTDEIIAELKAALPAEEAEA